MIELIVVLSIVAVAVGIFSSTVTATSRQRAINRQNALASESARMAVEAMRSVDFRTVFALYNEDPLDDPEGAGTAPGNTFDVPGLELIDDDPDGAVGLVILPSLEVDIPAEGELPARVEWQLREDFIDPKLGLPRDLNGDSIIDSANHGDDYFIIPVCIRVEWQGSLGRRFFETYTMLTDFDL